MPHTQQFTPRAPLLALGVKLRQLGVLKTLADNVQNCQKKLRHTSSEKLLDALLAVLAGGQGLCELNTRVKPDRALQKAFGRSCCADQSLVQATLNAASSKNVAQLMNTINELFQQHSLTARDDFNATMLMLDLDFSGLPCGNTYEYAEQGYQGENGIRYGRQLRRVGAAQYGEIVLDRLYPCNLYLTKTLRYIIADVETALRLTDEQRKPSSMRTRAPRRLARCAGRIGVLWRKRAWASLHLLFECHRVCRGVAIPTTALARRHPLGVTRGGGQHFAQRSTTFGRGLLALVQTMIAYDVAAVAQ